ncbi:MAG TPA: hypothetical protein DEQ14_03280 [Treponema sp.]|nr:hypothetical protein [Treponema sp.]
MEIQKANFRGLFDFSNCEGCKFLANCVAARQNSANKSCKNCAGCALCGYWVLRQLKTFQMPSIA